jgi:lactate dehydrogenase-like 2-hydroxyacid dehydrogenase
MSKPVILLLGAYLEQDMDALASQFEVIRFWEQQDKDATLRNSAHLIRAVATRGDLGAQKDLIDQLPSLEIIACFGVGTDAIDRTATGPRKIVITNTPDVLNDDVADLALGLMLAVARNIPQNDAFVRDGRWSTMSPPLETKLSGKRVGIVGLGRIGKAIAKRCQSFDMPVSYFGRQKQGGVAFSYFDSIAALAHNSDFLVAIVPGGSATSNLIGSEVFAALGQNGYFINVSRGSVVDEDALLHALENGSIKGAGLDVYWDEPKINPRFAKLKNVVLQPHQGSATIETRRAMGKLVRDNLAAYFAGKPLLTPID